MVVACTSRSSCGRSGRHFIKGASLMMIVPHIWRGVAHMCVWHARPECKRQTTDGFGAGLASCHLQL
jgi:hypothetical protein